MTAYIKNLSGPMTIALGLLAIAGLFTVVQRVVATYRRYASYDDAVMSTFPGGPLAEVSDFANDGQL